MWRWADVQPWLEKGIVPLLPWTFTLCTLTFMGIAAWCRAVFLAGSDRRFVPERLPAWVRQPLGMVVLSLVAPGSGHFSH